MVIIALDAGLANIAMERPFGFLPDADEANFLKLGVIIKELKVSICLPLLGLQQ